MNPAIDNEKGRIHFIFSIICIISLAVFITPVHAGVGDLILDTEILLSYPHHPKSKNFSIDSTLLKEGYSISLDGMKWVKATKGKEIYVTNYSIFKNGEVVKTVRVIGKGYFYYNKTIDGKECTIIEARVDSVFLGMGTDLVRLEPFRQYSDGSVIVEPDFITLSLNPYTNKTPPEEWNRTFVDNNFMRNDQSVQQTRDGSYILLGSIYMYTQGMDSMSNYYTHLIKTDTNGNEQWNRTFNDIGLQNAYSVLQTEDGGYILGGVVRSYHNRGSVRLVKIDSCGNIIWHTTMDAISDDYDYVMSVCQTLDDGYILAGFSNGEYVWLIKTDKNGSKQWNERFAVPGADNDCSVWQTDDGGYMLLCGTNRGYPSSTDAWIIKTYANGKQEWNKKFKSDCVDLVYSIKQAPDGGYLLAGSKGSSYDSCNACLVRTDANGIEQWNRTVGPGLIASIYSFCQAHDGGYVLAGRIDTAKNPELRGQIRYRNDDAWLFKTDANGNLEWSKIFGGLKNDKAGFVEQTSDGGYIIAGITESYGSGGSDLWLVKIAGKEGGVVRSEVQTFSINHTGKEDIQRSSGKSTPGFVFLYGVFSIFIILYMIRKNI